MDSGMLLLIIVLGGLSLYFICSPTSLLAPWLDKYCKQEKDSWTGENIGDGKPSKPKKKRVYKKRSKKK